MESWFIFPVRERNSRWCEKDVGHNLAWRRRLRGTSPGEENIQDRRLCYPWQFWCKGGMAGMRWNIWQSPRSKLVRLMLGFRQHGSFQRQARTHDYFFFLNFKCSLSFPNFRYCIATGDSKTVFSAEDTNSCCSGAVCSFSLGCNGGQPSGAWNWFAKVGVTSGADYGALSLHDILNFC